MDVLALLKRSIEALPDGSHRAGLFAVLRHIQVASRYLNRASETNESDLYTDVVYRTNQAFEGSIKEAYRVLSGEDPDRTSIFDVEEYLKGDDVLRERVLTQFTRYRKEWRNPSAHDYTLDFDQDEAFLALMSVAAFAKVLVDQIGQKLAERHAAERAKGMKELPEEPLLQFVGTETAALLNAMAEENDAPNTESELIGTLVGFLGYPELEFELDSRIGQSQRRADLVVSRGDETTVLEVKSTFEPSTLDLRSEAQMTKLIETSEKSTGLLVLWHPRAKGYQYYQWPSASETSDRLGVVLFSEIDPDAGEPSLGDILGEALRKNGGFS